jgi:hypothetical protein
MKATALALILCAFTSYSFAQTTTPEAKSPCVAQATDKKLEGAALNNFMKTCETARATAKCEATAAAMKLADDAKTSFTKKCIADAAGG